MIDAVLPDAAVGVDMFGDLAGARLFPEEEAQVSGAVDKRRREYTTVRDCARRALAGIGVTPGPLVRGAGGAPRWPAGLVGSMTHCDGYRAAAVARASEVSALGIDAEPNEPLPGDVVDQVLQPEERARIQRLAGWRPHVSWDRLWFSAKESVYKAWYPLTGRWLDFDAVSVAVFAGAVRGCTFTATLPRSPGRGLSSPSELRGRWACRNHLVVTAVHVPSDAPEFRSHATETLRTNLDRHPAGSPLTR